MGAQLFEDRIVGGLPSGGRVAIGVRVRLGVTGHRRLDDEVWVRNALVEQLGYLRELFAPTESTPVGFSLMTALAEGADRLVPREARRFLGQGQTELEAVLPLIVDDYLEDFDTAKSREEFHRLLDRAGSQVVLAGAPKPPGVVRNEAYATAGRYIVDRCDVLVAVWDGKEARGVGGTAETVAYARKQGAPVLIVPATRAFSDRQKVGTASALDPSSPRIQGVLESLRRIDEYNRSPLPAPLVDRTEKSARQPLETLAERSLIRAQLDDVAGWALPHLARADALALRYQTRYAYLARAVHLLALLAVVAVGAQIVFARRTPELLLIEVGVLVALLAAVWVGRRGRTHDRWIGYRSLAEAFRSAFFIVLAGASEQQEDGVVDPAMWKRPWSQRAFSEAWRQRPRVAYEEAAAQQLRDGLIKAWIETQIEYHRDAASRYERRRNWYARGISALAVITIAVALIHILAVPHPGGAANSLEFVAIVLPGLGAAIAGLREQGHYRLHQDRSNRTITRLERLKSHREPIPTLESVRRLAVETHRVIVEENQDWWGVIEFQDIELVI